MKTLFLIISCCWNIQCFAQLTETDTLYQILIEYDNSLFDAAFNLREKEELKKYLSHDLEFFHDKSGLIANSAVELVDAFERNWKKMRSGNKRYQRRESIAESIEVYPLENFGAMVMGEHKFYEYEFNGKEIFDSKAKYITLWKNENSKWTAHRIISYDHQLAQE